eukprot:6190794-Pleurochrysis_carterae.AAC.1
MGGMRDWFRDSLEAHYSKEICTFSRSFVVGRRNDVCAAAMGSACGLSLSTFYNARSDCRLNKPRHAGRCRAISRSRTVSNASISMRISEIRGALWRGTRGACLLGTGIRANARANCVGKILASDALESPCPWLAHSRSFIFFGKSAARSP